MSQDIRRVKYFASSDHHFGHANIIKYCHRLHSSVTEDMQYMIDGHNSVVNDNDICFFVGDVSANRQGLFYLPQALKAMRGRKILIRGNHDHQSVEYYKGIGFESVHEVLIVREFIFCHFPTHPEVCKLALERDLTLVCGHTHKPFPEDNFNDKVKRINVAIDVVGPVPTLLFETEAEI